MTLPLDYHRSIRLLESYGVPLVRMRLVASGEAATAVAAEIGFPVALKAISPAFSHKSDSGLVCLGLETEAQVTEAAARLTMRLGEAALEGFLIQEMVFGGVEAIAGIISDPQFGPLVLFGAGGVLTELLEDCALLLPPLNANQAATLILETRFGRLLRGFRHITPADLDALQDLLVRLGHLAVEQGSWLESLDLNPVIVLPAKRGVKVVDFRVFPRPQSLPWEP